MTITLNRETKVRLLHCIQTGRIETSDFPDLQKAFAGGLKTIIFNEVIDYGPDHLNEKANDKAE